MSEPSLSSELQKQITNKIQNILQERMPYAVIKLPNLEKLSKSPEIVELSNINSVRVIEERSNGVAVIDLTSTEGKSVRIQTPYDALVKVPVAIHRIFPNSKLRKDDFRMETINVSSGTAKDYRGLMIFDLNSLDNLETKQTILENQFVLRSQIQKSPDLRKGETVQVEITSGDLSLMTAATVLENASFGENVRIMTFKTKKEITGKVRVDRSVEVRI